MATIAEKLADLLGVAPSTNISTVIKRATGDETGEANITNLVDDVDVGNESLQFKVELEEGASLYGPGPIDSETNLPYICSQITSITLPKRVTHIAAGFASGLTALKEFHGRDLVEINMGNFMNLSSLEYVDLPNVETISQSAFDGCKNISSAYVPKLKRIEVGGWPTVVAAKELDFPSLEYASAACKSDNTTEPYSNVEKIHIGPNCETITSNSFSGHINLKELVIDGCETITDGSFNGAISVYSTPIFNTALKSLKLKNVKTIANGCFAGFKGLKIVWFSKALESLSGSFTNYDSSTQTVIKSDAICSCEFGEGEVEGAPRGFKDDHIRYNVTEAQYEEMKKEVLAWDVIESKTGQYIVSQAPQVKNVFIQDFTEFRSLYTPSIGDTLKVSVANDSNSFEKLYTISHEEHDGSDKYWSDGVTFDMPTPEFDGIIILYTNNSTMIDVYNPEFSSFDTASEYTVTISKKL